MKIKEIDFYIYSSVFNNYGRTTLYSLYIQQYNRLTKFIKLPNTPVYPIFVALHH